MTQATENIYGPSLPMPKVLKILSLLDVRSYKSFLKYLDSPYLNTNRKLLDFATYLFKYHPEFAHKNLKKENLDQFLFPGTSYNRKRITDYLSDLNRKLDFFLKLETLKQSADLQRRVLIDSYDSPGFYELFKKEIKKNTEQLKDEKVKGPNRYRLVAEFGEKLLFHPEFFGKKNDEEHVLLMEVMENLDMDFTFSKLRLITFYFSKRQFLTAEYSPNYLDSVLELSATLFKDKHVGFKLYLDLIALQKTSGNHKLFKEVSVLFFDNSEHLSVSDKKNIFICLANYCVQAINPGLEGFSYHDLLILYDSALSCNILMHNGQLSDSTFNNVVVAAIRASKIDYANSFMEENKQFLGDNIRMTAFSYCKASVCYAQKQYDEAISWLNGANRHSEIRYKVQWRYLLVKIYFEKFEKGGWATYELLESFLDAFSVFLRRNEELSHEKKAGYLEFIRFTKQLMKLYPKNWTEKKSLDQLKASITASRAIGRQWLLGLIEKAES